MNQELRPGKPSSLISKPPLVSIIMNCLNCEKYVREAIDSVYSQSYINWEIIFWDNASTDRSAGIANSYDERVRYFKSPETYPLGKARNLAISESRGDYIAFLDCDDLWLPKKLEKQVPLFENNHKVGLVFCDTIFFDDRGKTRQIYSKNKPPRGMVFNDLLRNYFLSMETTVVRREALEALDEWFDEHLTVTEEKDLFLRIAYLFELDFVDEPLAKWRVHHESWTHTKYELFALENEMILDKWMKRIPDFSIRFPEGYAALKTRICIQQAVYNLRSGKPAAARKALKKYGDRSLKIILILVVTRFPSALSRRLVSMYYWWRWI